MNTKKIIIILALVFLALMGILLWYLSKTKENVPSLITPTPTRLISPTITPIPPSPTWRPLSSIDPTIAAIPTQETGGNLEVTLTPHDEALNHLLDRLPLDKGGFTMTYDFAENKFAVVIFDDKGAADYATWRKTEYPSLQDEDFIILDKRQ